MNGVLLVLLVVVVVGVVLWVKRHPAVKAEVDADLADLEARAKAARDQATTATGGIRDWLRRLTGK